MIILALDPATKTGFACGGIGGIPMLGTVNFGGRSLDDHADIFARAHRWIDLQLGPTAIMGMPDVLAIEEPIAPWKVLGQTQYAATKIALGLQAIFQGRARERGVKVVTAPIRTWRKYVLHRGNMSGAEAKMAMLVLCKRLRWGDERLDHNAAEAAGIFLWAGGQVQPQRAQRHEPLFVGR